MGSLAIAVLVFTTIDKMKYSIILLVCSYIAYVQAGAWVYVDDAEEHFRVRRSPQEDMQLRRAGPPSPYAPQPSYAEDLPVSASASYGKGDPKAASDPSTPSSRLTPRPTSSGESVTSLDLSTEDRWNDGKLTDSPFTDFDLLFFEDSYR